MAITTRRASKTAAVQLQRDAVDRSPATAGGSGVRRQTQANSPMMTTPCASTTTASCTLSQQTPGKSADSCPRCTVLITNDTPTIKCDICQGNYHQKCTSIPSKTFEKLVAIVKVTGWVCDSCKDAARLIVNKTQSAMAVIAEQIAEIKQSISELQDARSTCNNATASASNPSNSTSVSNVSTDDKVKQQDIVRTETTMIVHQTLADIDKRRKNVIVSGLPETSNDRQMFIDMCETHLTVKPVVSDRDCVRLGEKHENRPRLLLVRLRSDDVTTEILRAAPKLRRCSDQLVAGSVYINPDLSPEAAKAAFERRQQRRAERLLRHGGNSSESIGPSSATAATTSAGHFNSEGRPSQSHQIHNN